MLNRNFLVGCGVGGGEAHRHWRIYITDDQAHNNIVQIGELEFRDSVGVAKQCTGGTPIFSTEQWSGSAAKAFDGLPGGAYSTSYISQTPLPQWIGYSFASPVSVAQVMITAVTALLSKPIGSPSAFSLQWSDNGSDWTTVQSFTKTDWTSSSPESATFNVTI